MEIKLFDLPRDKIYVELHETLHAIFFDELEAYEGFNQLFDNKLNKHTYRNWKYRNSFIPLWFLSEFLHLTKIKLGELQSNISSYKGPSSSTRIKNPKFPIVVDKRIVKILAHIIADGSTSGAHGTGLAKGKTHSEYRNFDDSLLNSFAEDLAAFGQWDVTINYSHGHVILPNGVAYILKHYFNVETGTFSATIPPALWELDPSLSAAFLRAFADDEGHVYDSSIELYSANDTLLHTLRALIERHHPDAHMSPIRCNSNNSRNPKYSLKFYNSCLLWWKNEIGFDSCRKKSQLKHNLIRMHSPGRKLNPATTILRVLTYHSLSAQQLARMFFIRQDTVMNHLNKFQMQNLVRVTHKDKGARVWKAIHQGNTRRRLREMRL